MADSHLTLHKIGKLGRWIVRNIEPVSDGEERHWPKPPYRPSSDENYRIQLANDWVEQDGLHQEGVNFYLNKLPEGYRVYEVNQPNGSQVYKRLFGHPTGKYYDSIIKFEPHFLWLMRGLKEDCTCHMCNKAHNTPAVPRQRRPRETVDPFNVIHHRPRQARDFERFDSESSIRENSVGGANAAERRVRRDVRQSGGSLPADKDGNEDVFKLFIQRLAKNKDSTRVLDEDIRELNSIDWRAEHEEGGYGADTLPTYLTQLEHQHSFVPRVGELVLWYADHPRNQYLLLDPTSHEYRFYSFRDSAFKKRPKWRAGVVTALPSPTVQNGPIDFPDILDLSQKATGDGIAGFRVETIPDPNNIFEKSVSKQYKYLPLRNIRPLSHWQHVMRNLPSKKIHPSIRYALTCSTTVSLLEKFKATGDWPTAWVHCKGVFIGHELITLGDTIRLLPQGIGPCTDVMIVDSIRLVLSKILPEHTERASPYLSSESYITLVGRAFTTDHTRGHREVVQTLSDHMGRLSLPEKVPREEIKTAFRPVGTSEYGEFYWLHEKGKQYEVTFDQVLGRLHEADAVRLWLGQTQHEPRNGQHRRLPPTLGFDVEGVIAARRYATATDQRLPKTKGEALTWYWADNRAEALAVETMGGLEVNKFYEIRDGQTMNEWHVQMKILNGLSVQSSEVTQYVSTPSGTRGRKPGGKLVNGRVVYPGDPEYEAWFGGEDVKFKPNSSMAGAALASTDEDDGDEDDDGAVKDVKMEASPKRRIDLTAPREYDDEESDTDIEVEVISPSKIALKNERLLQQFTQPKPPRKERTKMQIMTGAVPSIEGGGDLSSSDVDLADGDWKTLKYARGGTEESEGGDYRPE